MANKEYADWDGIVVYITKDDKSLGSIKMMRQDLEAMAENHEIPYGDVMGMMVQAILEQIKEKEETETSEDALS